MLQSFNESECIFVLFCLFAMKECECVGAMIGQNVGSCFFPPCFEANPLQILWLCWPGSYGMSLFSPLPGSLKGCWGYRYVPLYICFPKCSQDPSQAVPHRAVSLVQFSLFQRWLTFNFIVIIHILGRSPPSFSQLPSLCRSQLVF